MRRTVRTLSSAVILAILVALPAAAQQLTGTWRGMMATPWGQVMGTEVIFFPNGTYTSVAVMGTLMTRHWGRYQVVQNWIHFDLQGAEPREYCGPQRCIPLAWPQSETWVITAFDGRTLQTANGRLERVQ